MAVPAHFFFALVFLRSFFAHIFAHIFALVFSHEFLLTFFMLTFCEHILNSLVCRVVQKPATSNGTMCFGLGRCAINDYFYFVKNRRLHTGSEFLRSKKEGFFRRMVHRMVFTFCARFFQPEFCARFSARILRSIFSQNFALDYSINFLSKCLARIFSQNFQPEFSARIFALFFFLQKF